MAAENNDLVTKKKLIATPAVRRIIRQNNIDLALVTGTGRDGRVLKDDILNFLDVNQQGYNLYFFIVLKFLTVFFS